MRLTKKVLRAAADSITPDDMEYHEGKGNRYMCHAVAEALGRHREDEEVGALMRPVLERAGVKFFASVMSHCDNYATVKFDLLNLLAEAGPECW